MAKIAVGTDVDAYCTKCKLVLGHTVVAMQGARPRRVKCNTCNGEHNYRPTKPVAKVSVKEPSKTAAKTGGAKKPAKAKASPRKTKQTWEEAMQEASNRPRKPYSMAGSFGEGDWIDHSHFGIGCVQTFTPPNKIVVRFADSTRTLVCNRTN